MSEAKSEPSGIPLAKAIQDLRAELLDALREGRGKELRFKLKPIELELSVGMTWTGEAHGGVKFWIVDLGAKGEGEQARMHKLKLVLEPNDPDGGEFCVRDTAPGRPA
jgi:hypothetical protein